MPIIHSFAPITGSYAKVLILGSMPGEASLAANRYYAHQRNAFWPIMSRLLHIQPEAGYEEKITAIESSSIALWDVLKSCERSGSLDSSIEPGTQTINDFQTFFSIQQKITHVFFNGGKAENCFRRYVLPSDDWRGAMRFVRLPSTSPANARLSFDRKCEIWCEAILSVLAE